jgi:hypothetical protein
MVVRFYHSSILEVVGVFASGIRNHLRVVRFYHILILFCLIYLVNMLLVFSSILSSLSCLAGPVRVIVEWDTAKHLQSIRVFFFRDNVHMITYR